MINTSLQSGVTTEISAAHFGTIWSTFFDAQSYATQTEALSGTSIRWPGGMRGEARLDSGDKDGDGDTTEYLFDPQDPDLLIINNKGLDDVIALAEEEGLTVATFVPVQRYLEAPDTAYADMLAYLENLFAGDRNVRLAALGGIEIELGNENLDRTLATAEAYGRVASEQLRALADFMQANEGKLRDVDLTIGIQSGFDAAEAEAVLAQLQPGQIDLIDQTVTHYLPLNINTLNKDREREDGRETSEFAERALAADVWDAAAGRSLDQWVSAWSVGTDSFGDAEALEYSATGLAQAHATVDTLFQALTHGADAMYIWGLDARSNPNWVALPGTVGATEGETGGEVVLSPTGHAFETMASFFGAHGFGDYDLSYVDLDPGASGYDAYVFTGAGGSLAAISLEAGAEVVSYDVADGYGVSAVTYLVEDAGGVSTLGDPRPLDASAEADPVVRLDMLSDGGVYTEDAFVFVELTSDSLPEAAGETISMSSSVAAFRGEEADAFVFGTGGNDELLTTDADELIRPRAGDDYVYLQGGRDVIELAAGSAQINLVQAAGFKHVIGYTPVVRDAGGGMADRLVVTASDAEAIGIAAGVYEGATGLMVDLPGVELFLEGLSDPAEVMESLLLV